jgi:exopolysaccharide production protein ExoQ
MLVSLAYVLAALLGVALPAVLLLTAHFARFWSDGHKLMMVLCTMALTPALGAAVSGRVLSTEREILLNPALAIVEVGGGLSPWISRLGTALILCVCLAEVLRWLMGQRTMPAQARTVWLAAMGYYVVIFGLAGLAGDNIRFISINLLYEPILFTALALYAPALSDQGLRTLSWVLRLVFIGSLIGAAVAPAAFTNREYSSLIPGLSWRLVGLSDHANSVGAVALLGLLLEVSTQVWKRPHWFFLVINLTVLIGAQSKTAWVGAVAVLLLSKAALHRHFDGGDGTHAYKAWSRLCWLCAGTLVIYGVVMHFDLISALDTQFSGYTGRDKIWDVTFSEFERSPLLGYGPALWDMQYRLEQGMPYVGQSHNQFMQTLGQGGLIGIGALLVYLGILLWRSFLALRRGSSLALLAVLVVLIRCQMETPLLMNSILSADALVHALTFVFAAGVARLDVTIVARTPPTMHRV